MSDENYNTNGQAMRGRLCTSYRTDGAKCMAVAHNDSPFCVDHDPETKGKTKSGLPRKKRVNKLKEAKAAKEVAKQEQAVNGLVIIKKRKFPKLSDEFIVSICTAVRGGATQYVAAMSLGIDRPRFNKWMDRGETAATKIDEGQEVDPTDEIYADLYHNILAAQGLSETDDVKRMNQIIETGEGHAGFLQWKMINRYKGRWERVIVLKGQQEQQHKHKHEITGEGGGPVKHQHFLSMISTETKIQMMKDLEAKKVQQLTSNLQPNSNLIIEAKSVVVPSEGKESEHAGDQRFCKDSS